MRRIRNAIARLRRPRTTDEFELRRLGEEVLALRGEIDELRADSSRIAELYDLVFVRLRERD